MTNIIFQDIDGPLIPHRMYYRGNRLFDPGRRTFLYDPVAVDMINALCERYSAKIVFNSAHNENPPEIMKYQAKCNNLHHHLHDDCKTPFTQEEFTRLSAIEHWLSRHPEVNKWIVIDDMEVGTPNQIRVDYTVGMSLNNFMEACSIFDSGSVPISPKFVSTFYYPDKIQGNEDG